MRKLIYAFFLCGLTLLSFAQEEITNEAEAEKPKKEKDACDYLPGSGDFAIGVDALPYIEFLGNMFSGHDSRNTLNLGATTIYGKYYLSTDAAVRFELHLDKSTDIDKAYVQDDANFNTNPNAQVEDLRNIKNNNVGIGVGYQMYRGYGKLRGTYGVVASYYYGKEKTEYNWGNQMTASNVTPTSTNWLGTGSNPSERNLNSKSTGIQSIGIGAIAGVEYFFAPKICVGGELGLYLTHNWTGQSSYTYEVVEAGTKNVYDVALAPGSSYTSIATSVYNVSNVAGRLYVLFHF
jgi:hypothetical protein